MTDLEKAEAVWEEALSKWRSEYYKSQKAQNKAFDVLAAARKVWDAAQEKVEEPSLTWNPIRDALEKPPKWPKEKSE